jgi:hypothetical protein
LPELLCKGSHSWPAQLQGPYSHKGWPWSLALNSVARTRQCPHCLPKDGSSSPYFVMLCYVNTVKFLLCEFPFFVKPMEMLFIEDFKILWFGWKLGGWIEDFFPSLLSGILFVPFLSLVTAPLTKANFTYGAC